MKHIKEIYQNEMIYIFNQEQCLDLNEDYLVIIKDGCEIKPLEGCMIMHYQDDFESLLKFKLPGKMRKTKQLLSYDKTCELIDKMAYGVLSFSTQEVPYSVGLNYVFMDNRLYFHCAQTGFKLNGIGQRASFLVVEDLGINLQAGTHNHQSAYIIGQLHQVQDFDTKRSVLLKLIEKLSPSHPLNDDMVSFTNILELDVDYLIGKSHIR